MPEGPEIRRARDQLSTVLEKTQTQNVFFAFDKLKPYSKKLKNKRITRIDARGKAMLVHFSHGLTIYSHNQLYGKWYISQNHQEPEVKRQLRLSIKTNKGSAFLYSASEIEVLETKDIPNHPYIRKLGLELLEPNTTIEQVIDTLRQQCASRRRLMSLLQDQTVLAGIGNYLCCEILHITHLHPNTRLCDLNDKQIKQLAKNSIKLTRQSYQTSGITNQLTRAKKLKQQGVAFEDYRFYVYRRAGLPCYQCGKKIIKDNFAGRMGYACLGCQK